MSSPADDTISAEQDRVREYWIGVTEGHRAHDAARNSESSCTPSEVARSSTKWKPGRIVGWLLVIVFVGLFVFKGVDEARWSHAQRFEQEQRQSQMLTSDEALAAFGSTDPELRGLMHSFLRKERETYLRVPAPPELKRRAAEELRRIKSSMNASVQAPASNGKIANDSPAPQTEGPLSDGEVEALRVLGDSRMQRRLEEFIQRHGLQFRIAAADKELHFDAHYVVMSLAPDEWRAMQQDASLKARFDSAFQSLSGTAQVDAVWSLRKDIAEKTGKPLKR